MEEIKEMEEMEEIEEMEEKYSIIYDQINKSIPFI